jgi:uncharacterized membrane protein
MNAAHFHLMFNHLPLVGFGFTFLLQIIAVIRNNPELKIFSCWFYILVALLCIIPIVTGDGSAEILKTYPGISSDAIEYHETWGYLFFYGLLLNGALSIVALWFTRRKQELMKKLTVAMLGIGLVISVFAFMTGSTGGKIMHPEIEQGIYKK